MSTLASRSCTAGLLAATAALVPVVLAGPASADRTFHTTRYALEPVAGAPLAAGWVIDVHTQGPVVYAQERYHLAGALPSTTHQVTLQIHLDAACTTQIAAIDVDTLTTNAAGNANGAATFAPEDAAGLQGLGSEFGLEWVVTTGGQVVYATGCQVVPLD